MTNKDISTLEDYIKILEKKQESDKKHKDLKAKNEDLREELFVKRIEIQRDIEQHIKQHIFNEYIAHTICCSWHRDVLNIETYGVNDAQIYALKNDLKARFVRIRSNFSCNKSILIEVFFNKEVD